MNTPRGSLVNFVNMPLQPGSAGPTKHLKANWYAYQTALSKEMARIERIKELRTQMLGLICTAIASAFFTVGSFLGRGIYNYLGPERSFFPLPSDY